MKACKNLLQNKIVNLSDRAREHFVQSFGDYLKVKDFSDIWMAEDPIQMTDSVTCGYFQLYFYEDLFDPDETNKMQNNKRLTKKTIETLLNEFFTFDKKKQSTTNGTISH